MKRYREFDHKQDKQHEKVLLSDVLEGDLFLLEDKLGIINNIHSHQDLHVKKHLG